MAGEIANDLFRSGDDSLPPRFTCNDGQKCAADYSAEAAFLQITIITLLVATFNCTSTWTSSALAGSAAETGIAWDGAAVGVGRTAGVGVGAGTVTAGKSQASVAPTNTTTVSMRAK
jgi:hypothetical protein